MCYLPAAKTWLVVPPFTTRLQKREKLLIFNINLSTFEVNLFSYFVHVISLNDVIKQRVKIIEECDNLQEMTRWEVSVWFHSTWSQRKLTDHAITLRTMKPQPLLSNRKTPPKTNTVLKWSTTCDQATRHRISEQVLCSHLSLRPL